MKEISDLKKFRSLRALETDAMLAAYEKAKEAYIAALRNFVIVNITGKRDFKKAFKQAVCQLYFEDPEYSAAENGEEIDALIWLISFHDSHLEELEEESS